MKKCTDSMTWHVSIETYFSIKEKVNESTNVDLAHTLGSCTPHEVWAHVVTHYPSVGKKWDVVTWWYMWLGEGPVKWDFDGFLKVLGKKLEKYGVLVEIPNLEGLCEECGECTDCCTCEDYEDAA